MLSTEGRITAQWLRSEGPLPLLIKSSADQADPVFWASENREWLEAQLLKHGALLIRNFGVRSADEFERFVVAISGQLLDYTNRSTPRTQVSGKIYTSTEYPASQSIPLHNELSYAQEWPLKIWFFCTTPARERGETPIADSRGVFNRIDAGIRERFIKRKVMYSRTYG